MRTPEDTATDADQLIRFGAIASVDLAAARCVVELDDDALTGPIRWIEMRMGKTRTWSPPSEREQVVLLCPAGEIGAAIALRGLISDEFAALGDSLAELIEFLDGALLSYDPEGHALAFVLPGGATFRVVASGGATFEGPLHCTGDISTDGDVKAGGISLTSHKHSGVAAGGAISGGPQ
jgi:phage baseplate assembly protein V